jgi:hypothetical protein
VAWLIAAAMSAIILETAVGHTRWCVWAGGGREATPPQAEACKE